MTSCDPLPANWPVGSSPATQALRADLEATRAVPNEPVLILGESGAGKELTARWIHLHSRPKGSPFVDHVATSTTRVHVDLFGAVRGAYTGAEGGPGKAEAAGKGTLFLDEIGELSRETQVELLRFLDNRRFHPVGSTTARTFRGRLVFATNRTVDDLKEHLRHDFLSRIKQLVVVVPSFRERHADLPDLIRSIAGTIDLGPDAVAALASLDWPTNARGVHSALTTLRARCGERRITAVDVASHIGTATGGSVHVAEMLAAQFRRYGATRAEIQHAAHLYVSELVDAHGLGQTATRLAASRGSIRRKLRAAPLAKVHPARASGSVIAK